MNGIEFSVEKAFSDRDLKFLEENKIAQEKAMAKMVGNLEERISAELKTQMEKNKDFDPRHYKIVRHEDKWFPNGDTIRYDLYFKVEYRKEGF